MAPLQGEFDITKLLLDRGAGANIQAGHSGTVLQAASLQDEIEIPKLLLERGANINIQAGKFGAALQEALYMDNNDVEELLRNRGALESGSLIHLGECLLRGGIGSTFRRGIAG